MIMENNNKRSVLLRVNVYYHDRFYDYKYIRVQKKFSLKQGRWLVNNEDIDKAVKAAYPYKSQTKGYTFELEA